MRNRTDYRGLTVPGTVPTTWQSWPHFRPTKTPWQVLLLPQNAQNYSWYVAKAGFELRSYSKFLLSTTLYLSWTQRTALGTLSIRPKAHSQFQVKLPQYRMLSYFLWPMAMFLRSMGHVPNLTWSEAIHLWPQILPAYQEILNNHL